MWVYPTGTPDVSCVAADIGTRFSSRLPPGHETRCVPREVAESRRPPVLAEPRAAKGRARTVRLAGSIGNGRFITETTCTLFDAFVACIWRSCQRIFRLLARSWAAATSLQENGSVF